MLVVINTSDVKVPKIEKFKHDESQDELTIALNNMRNLTSYKLDFKEISVSATTNGTVSSGFTEIITNDICHFTPYDVLFNKNIETHIPKPNESYGYKKINDDLYNTYMMDETNNTYKATRAYKKDFSSAKPSFKIAPELFTSYSIDEKTNEKYYYLDKLMCSAASTFYYGVGNDINLYGIFAGIGRVSESKSFTPYVVLKDSYITNACFYFNLGSIYGVVELKYSDFNKTEFNEDIDFTTRNLPTSWKELFITVSNETTNEEVSVVALDYLKEFYDDEKIEEKMPFFGKVLDDTFGFAFNTYHKPADKDIGKKAIAFYYDVALDVDYTIDSSMRKIENYLISLGFTKNSYNEYSKDDIVIYPSDAGLDLVIYAWKK